MFCEKSCKISNVRRKSKVSLNSIEVSKRKTHIDLLRIIAIYMVVFNHTGTKGFMLYTVSKESVFYSFYMFNAIFIKVAVPLFFMITGALLLNREESIEKIVKDRFLKYLIVLVVSSAIAYIYMSLRKNPQELSLIIFIKKLYSSQHATALWYLYAYLAYLLMLPFLRKMARNMTNTEYIWMFVLYGAINTLSIIEFIVWKGEIGHNGSFSFFITTYYVFYPLMGYFIEYRMKREDFNWKNLIVMLVMSFIAIVVSCLASQYRSTLLDAWNEENGQTFFKTLIFIPAITVYYATKMIFIYNKVSDKTKRALAVLGDTTFGLYLIEYICRNETLFVFNFLKPIIHTLPACWVWIEIACLIGMFITFWLKKLPLIRNFI